MGALSSDNFTVVPNPLETRGGEVTATINGSFPEKYMKRNATVTVIPELRCSSGKVIKGESASFQGENVMGNNQTISYRIGGHYTMKTAFKYEPEIQNSEMYLSFNVHRGSKKTDVPSVKVANGVITTSELYRRTLMNAGGCIAPDSFQRVKALKQEANVKFLINQANIRKSELKNNSVTEFVRLLKKINDDREQLNLRNVEVRAYASPDGGVDFNDKLASKRQDVSEDYVKSTLKNNKMNAYVDARYTAQDWEGFQTLVKASNIQDKDVILRVLSMYKDPQEREQQIRNMSEGFRELADGILPELRRSRLIINYETIGKDDEEIRKLSAENPIKLTPDELLYSATLEDDANRKEAIYRKAIELYDKDYRAYNNMAVMEFNKGNDESARVFIERAFKANPKAPEANANLALIALKNGNIQEAETYLSNATGANGFNEVYGNLCIAKGNYAQAEESFKDSYSNSAALAQILNRNYAAADATLKNIKNPDAMTLYLRAILNARQGNKFAASKYSEDAVQMDAQLAGYAANDLELNSVK